jgi:hypothetical protein
MMYALIGGGVVVAGLYVLGFAFCVAASRADRMMEEQRLAQLPPEWEDIRLRDIGITPPQHHIASVRSDGWSGAASKRGARRPAEVAGA